MRAEIDDGVRTCWSCDLQYKVRRVDRCRDGGMSSGRLAIEEFGTTVGQGLDYCKKMVAFVKGWLETSTSIDEIDRHCTDVGLE